MPLVELMHQMEGKSAEKALFIGEYMTKLKDFTLSYHGSKGSFDPSTAFAIIRKQKSYFGNYSQQDSYDALLTTLDGLITEQKKLYAKQNGVDTKPEKIPDITVPLGQIFSFYLSSKCMNIVM